MMDRLKMETKDMTQDSIEKIGELFPGVVTETIDPKSKKVKKAVDFDLLRQMLSEVVVEGGSERYNFTWPGKKEAIIEANRPIRKTLRPCVDESKDWNNTKNVYIKGDNLEALKLLQESYLNSVKLIYIDPPYNTGSDFIYNDDFSISKNEQEVKEGSITSEGDRLFKNSESNGRFHSDWCSMIYPRLKLARNLLSHDGAIFISIDDGELSNLVNICNEIFGEHNKIAIICHKSRASISNDKIISPNHNFILFYAKDAEVLYTNRKTIGLDPLLEGFELDDNDGRGSYRLVPVDGPGGAKKGNPYYEFLGVEGYFRFSKDTMTEKYQNGLVVKKGNSLYQKYYLSAARETRRTDNTWWDDGGLTSSATSKLKQLMGNSSFDTPKPVELIERMIKLITGMDKNAIIMDFFAGSSTTAHAVMLQNESDGGNRKYILVQIQQMIDEKTDAYKSGYKTIDEIGIQRIRRVGEIIQSDDTGFRVFVIDDSNMKDVYYSSKDYTQQTLEGAVDNIKEGRNGKDLLFSVILDWGMKLSLPHRCESIDGKKVHIVDENALVACFEKHINEKTILEIAKKHPSYAVFRDYSFDDSSNKINLEEIFKAESPDTVIKVI